MGYEHPAEPVAADDHTIAAINLNNHVALSDMIGFRAILALSADITDLFARVGRSDWNICSGELVSQAFVRLLRHRNEHFGAVFRKERNVTVVEEHLNMTRLNHKIPDRVLC